MAFSRDGDGENHGLTLVGGSAVAANANSTAPAPSPTAAVKLAQLKQEHRDLDEAIQALGEAVVRDQLQMTRMKKRKLMLRDLIAKLEDEIVPDIIA